MWSQLGFIAVGIVISMICVFFKLSDLLTVILAFLPVVLNVVYNNVEVFRLYFYKIILRNKTVAIKIDIKNTYELNTDIDDRRIIEELLRNSLLKNEISIGTENNRIRLEANQTIKFARDNNLRVTVPMIIDLQVEDNKLNCRLNNTLPAITYKEIPELIKTCRGVWGFIDTCLATSVHMNLQAAVYSAQIKVNSDVFKNVYLASYAQKAITTLDLQQNNCKIRLNADTLSITSKSQVDFEAEILKYSSIGKSFWDNGGGR